MSQVEGDATHPTDDIQALTAKLRSKQLLYIVDIITEFDDDLSLESLLECRTADIMGLIDEINNDETNQHNITYSKKIKFAKIITTYAQGIKVVDPNTKIVRVIVGEEEEQAMNELDVYESKITTLIEKVNERNHELTANTKQGEAKIESMFNALIEQIQNQKQKMKHDLQEITQTKRSKITLTLQRLQAEHKKIKEKIQKCNAWMQDATIGRTQRKEHILGSYNEVNKQRLTDDVVDMNVEIYCESMQKDAVSSFISNVCCVYGHRHPIPIIQNVECKSIRTTEATVHFDASLSEQDEQKKVHSTLFIKLECSNDDIDEKEKETISSNLFTFNKDKQHYEYKLKALKKDRQYMFNINLFEGTQDDEKHAVRRRDHKPIVVSFKTDQKYESFVYQSDFDTNGICYYLATNNNQRQWTNPADQGVIAVTSSGMSSGTHNKFLDREATLENFTNNTANQWFCVDFGAKLRIKPTAYTLRKDTYNPVQSGNPKQAGYIRNWNFEGSNDGNDWTAIKQHTNDASLTAPKQSHTWTIADCTDSYQMFRIYLTAVDGAGWWHLMCQGFEIYGHLYGEN
eukprot:978778_1